MRSCTPTVMRAKKSGVKIDGVLSLTGIARILCFPPNPPYATLRYRTFTAHDIEIANVFLNLPWNNYYAGS